jgi:PKD repeat protein
MQTTARILRFAASAMLAAGLSACGVESQDPPSLIGPSGFALSLSLAATPEVLSHDGQSQSVITAVARDDAGRLVPNLVVRWDATASSPRALPITLSATNSVTDENGQTSVILSAPPPPTETPATPDTITIAATPQGDSSLSETPRIIVVTLRPAPGLPLRNNDPIAAFSMNPGAGVIEQDVRFDASAATDEGELCLDRCTYLWDFGDARTASGRIVTHRYSEASSAEGFIVTLTVRDERGGVNSLQQNLVVTGPALPVALFTVTPSSPTAGLEATFDASGSTTGTGVAITRYSWTFGDGTTAETTVATIGKTYDEARTYPVTLTITDSLGRTATTASSITVSEP